MKTTKIIAEYIGEDYIQGSDIRLAIETLQLPTIIDPPEEAMKDEEGNVSKLSEFMWQKVARGYIKMKRLIDQSVKCTY